MMIVAAAQGWRADGEVLATGIGTGPRLAAGLARLAYNDALMLTDGEAWLVEEPVPPGPREAGYRVKASGWMTYERVFDCLWQGHRHALVMPTQIDRFGQTNISWLGDDPARPKTQLLGVRGFPGNSMHHANSFFVSGHSKRIFVAGEVDMVCSMGYNPGRRLPGTKTFIDLRRIVTDLCVMDFGGPDHAVRVASLHPGVSFDEVQDATGFPLAASPDLDTTPPPVAGELQIIRALDPHNLRASIVRGNPAPRH
ncbi:CoA-transferase subunit beta [Paraburkholderia hayleyella]|uniref:CoA-transferase subunit beta n=1 Tax=Paraburkholderia hayleyella TaxID=2152889 RepID=UPI003CCD67A2